MKMAFLLIGAKIVLKSLLIEKAKATCSKSYFLVLHNSECLNISSSVYTMKESGAEERGNTPPVRIIKLRQSQSLQSYP